MTSNKLENYLKILTIRRAARRRDTRITGGVFFVSFIALFALGMLERLNGRSLYLSAAIVVAFGFSYLTAWVKLQIIDGSVELIENLKPSDEELLSEEQIGY